MIKARKSVLTWGIKDNFVKPVDALEDYENLLVGTEYIRAQEVSNNDNNKAKISMQF